MQEAPIRVNYREVLPTEAATRVDQVIEKIREMGANGQWFTLRTPDELQTAVPQIQAAVDRYREAAEPYGDVEIFLNSPTRPVDDLLVKVAKKAKVLDAVDIAGEAAATEVDTISSSLAEAAAVGRETSLEELSKPRVPTRVPYDVMLASFVARQAVTWEVLADLPLFAGKPNPGLALLDVYAQGAASVNFLNVDGQKRFSAELPIILPDETRALGLWIDGDRTVTMQRSWTDVFIGGGNLSPLDAAGYVYRNIQPLRFPR